MSAAFAPIDVSAVGIPREGELFAKGPATPIFNHLLDDFDVKPMPESDDDEPPAEPHPGVAEPNDVPEPKPEADAPASLGDVQDGK